MYEEARDVAMVNYFGTELKWICASFMEKQESLRVLIFTRHLLLGDLLECILSNTTLLCPKQAKSAGLDELLQMINRFQPEVLVVEKELLDDHLTCLFGLLENGRLRRIVLVSSRTNQVHVYDKSQIPLTRAADFITLLTQSIPVGK